MFRSGNHSLDPDTDELPTSTDNPAPADEPPPADEPAGTDAPRLIGAALPYIIVFAIIALVTLVVLWFALSGTGDQAPLGAPGSPSDTTEAQSGR